MAEMTTKKNKKQSKSSAATFKKGKQKALYTIFYLHCQYTMGNTLFAMPNSLYDIFCTLAVGAVYEYVTQYVRKHAHACAIYIKKKKKNLPCYTLCLKVGEDNV